MSLKVSALFGGVNGGGLNFSKKSLTESMLAGGLSSKVEDDC